MARTSQERKRRRQAQRGRDEAGSRAGGAAQEADADDDDESALNGALDDGGGVFKQLKDTASDAALVVLKPVAKRAATRAAKYAVEQGPRVLEDTVLPKLAEAGGPKGLVQGFMGDDGPGGAAKGLLERVTGGGDGDGSGDAGDGTGKGRRMPVQQAVDIAAPLDIVYDQFTQFEDFPKFMHRVERVEQRDDTHVVFHGKVWGINREWEAEIVEQRPDERIVWKTVSGLSHTGVVTFHELAERLTRVELNIDVDPNGPIEKMGRGLRFVKRAARADLKRFKAYVEMHEDETGAWLGEIEDGEVVSDHDDYYEDEYEDEDQEEPEDAYEDEDYEEEEEEDEDDDGDEEEKPKSRSSSSGRSRSRGSSAKSGSSNSKSKSRTASTASRSRSSSSRGKASSSRGRSSGSSSRSKSSGGSSGRSRGSSKSSSSSKKSSSGGRSKTKAGGGRR
jgi:uncharacterized membrane protein